MSETRSDYEGILKRVVLEKLGNHERNVTNDARFIEDLGFDSLDVMDLVMTIEEKFELEIPDDEAMKITCVGEAVEYLKGRLGS